MSSGCHLSCTHKPTFFPLLQGNIQEALQDSGVGVLQSILLRSWIQSILVLNFLKASSQQFPVHLLVFPEKLNFQMIMRYIISFYLPILEVMIIYKQITLYTDPKPPSPILFLSVKLLVALAIVDKSKTGRSISPTSIALFWYDLILRSDLSDKV